MLSQHPLSLDPDFCNPFNETNYFSVCNCIVLPSIVCFSKFAFRLQKTSFVEKNLIHRPVRKTSNKKSTKTPSTISGLERWLSPMNVEILKPPGCSSFQYWATWFYLERLATQRDSAYWATRDSGDSATRPTLVRAYRRTTWALLRCGGVGVVRRR